MTTSGLWLYGWRASYEVVSIFYDRLNKKVMKGFNGLQAWRYGRRYAYSLFIIKQALLSLNLSIY